MKTSHYFFIALTAIALFQFSCKKDSPVDDDTDPFIFPPQPNPVLSSSDSVLLVKMFVLDTTLVAPLDTIGRMAFSYDASQRPLSITYTDFQPSGDSNYYWHARYEYAGNDTLASRTIEYVREFQATIDESRDTFYYHFSNGICDLDSLAGENFYETNRYEYLPGYLNRSYISRGVSPDYSITGTARIYLTKIDGNLTYQLDTLIRHSTPGNPMVNSYLRNEYSFSYTNHPDPFYKITAPVKQEYYGWGDWLPFGKYVTKNLLSEVSHATSYWETGGTVNGSNNTSQYTYTFRSDGYPIEGRITYSSSGGPYSNYKTIYIYQ